MPQIGQIVTGPNGAATAWFDDPTLLACFPLHMRAYATYSRLLVVRRTGRVFGGSLILRIIHRLTPALHLPRDARVDVGGRIVHVDLTDPRFLWVLDEVRGRGHEYRVMQSLLRPGDTFLDVGANHGSFAILASHLVGPEGRVVAVEPQPTLARLVRRSLAEAPAPFDVHATALADRDREAVIHIPRSGSGSASLAAVRRGMGRSIAVPVGRADDLLPWRDFPGAVVLKLDVEGSEVPFLRGARMMIRERQPVIVFELSAEMARAAGYEPSDLIAELRSLGYRRFAEIDRYPEEVNGPVSNLEIQRNLVALPSP